MVSIRLKEPIVSIAEIPNNKAQPTALEGEATVSLVALVFCEEVCERVVFEFNVGVDEGGVR
jgi:hypothetical protein